MVKVDLSGAQAFFQGSGPDYGAAAEAHRLLETRTGAGHEFTGWLELPQKIRDGEPMGSRSRAEDDFATEEDEDFLD